MGTTADGNVGGSSLDFVSYDLTKPGCDMDVVASVQPEGGRRFTSVSWSSLGSNGGAYPYGIIAGGLSEGIVSLWNPHAVLASEGRDLGVLYTGQAHAGAVHSVEFHPVKPNLLATCGADSEVNIFNVDRPQSPDSYKAPGSSKIAGAEILCCSWNRTVPHILCASSNTGITVVWDLKMKKEVISFKDPADRHRCSDVVWNPEVPTQLLVTYDDDRNPSMQMWDLRNCQFPFKETSGHTKGILGVAWNPMDPNLLISCGKDNKLLAWCLSTGSPEVFAEIPCQQGNFEVGWAPYRPGIISASSLGGSVNIHTMQQQNANVRYCPKWHTRPCGASLGFGGAVLSFGRKSSSEAKHQSFCHSLLMPSEPEVTPEADSFEQWFAEKKFQSYCMEKTQKSGSGSPESLMWEMMALQFQGDGRQNVPSLLGFEKDKVLQKAEAYLGQKPGSMLADKPSEHQPHVATAAPPPQPVLDEISAEQLFADIAATTDQRKKEEEEMQSKQAVEATMAALSTSTRSATTNNWSSGPEALIKEALLIGNLAAAVECCFKSGRMAEGLLLASGGGTTLWTRARDEYLRLQEDHFLSTVGNIMTQDFEKVVSSSDLSSWTETLAIISTYSGDNYKGLCEQLGERLEKEKFDIRSAVVCYICARNFSRIVNLWAGALAPSKLALQDLAEKMAVLQEATGFQQTDPIFSAKVTQYAEILANSGRLTTAMRYLSLLQPDASSLILRDRIYNASPQQMGALFGRPPQSPFSVVDVRLNHRPQAQVAAVPSSGPVAAPGVGVGQQGQRTAGSSNFPPRPATNMSSMPPNPTGGRPSPGSQPAPSGPAPVSQPQMPPAPRLGNPGFQPPAPGGFQPPAPGGFQPPAPGGFQHQGGYNPGSVQPGAPCAGFQPPPIEGQRSTAPAYSAMPTVSGMPESWPLPTAAMQPLSTTKSVAEANMAVQAASRGGVANQVTGDPMPDHDLHYIRGVFTNLMDAGSMDVRKRNDIAKRLDELYTKLQAGHVDTTVSQKVMQMARSLESQDYAAANKIQSELCNSAWDQNKNWLMGIKRLVPAR